MTHEQIVKEAKEKYPLPERNHTSESNSLDRVIIILQQKAWIAARTLSMQEREKEMSDCWEAAIKYERQYRRSMWHDTDTTAPDKQQYIKQILNK